MPTFHLPIEVKNGEVQLTLNVSFGTPVLSTAYQVPSNRLEILGVQVYILPPGDVTMAMGRAGIGTYAPITDIDSAVLGLKNFLAKHPRCAIRDNLEEVFFFDDLRNGKERWGGTILDNAILATSCGANDVLGTERVLHHEFAHLLYRNFPFPISEWLALQPIDSRYLGDTVRFLDGTADGFLESTALLRNGFVRAYSAANAEEDFCTVSEILFVDPGKLRGFKYRSPVIREKIELAMEFYRSVNPSYRFEL